MALTNSAGTIYTDATGLLYTGRVKVSYIIITAASSHAEATLHDGTSGSDPIKLVIRNGTNNDSQMFDFSSSPVVFNSGIYLSTIGTGARVMLITTSAGAST